MRGETMAATAASPADLAAFSEWLAAIASIQPGVRVTVSLDLGPAPEGECRCHRPEGYIAASTWAGAMAAATGGGGATGPVTAQGQGGSHGRGGAAGSGAGGGDGGDREVVQTGPPPQPVV